MRVKKRKKVHLLFSAAFIAFIFLSLEKTEASKMNFSQGILPAKFIYLDEKEKIIDVWTNVSERDDLYAIKFYNIKTKAEIRLDRELIEKYVRSAEAFQAGERRNSSVDFIKNGDTLEEIRTAV